MFSNKLLPRVYMWIHKVYTSGSTMSLYELMQQNLRRSTELLQSVFNGISDPFILLAPDGTLKMVNQAFLLRNNISMDAALGVTIYTIVSQQQCLFSGRTQVLDLQVKEPHTEEIELNDGSIFDINFYPILNRDDSVHAIICFAKDVTGVKETERRIQQAQKLVAVGQLAAGVAHEINNPLIASTNADLESKISDYRWRKEYG